MKYVQKCTLSELSTPQTIVELGSDALREIGASTRKAENIVYIAQAIFDHALDLDALRDMRDEDVVAKLVELPGIGRWTAEMVLIFSLLRKNIVSYTDFGIKKGMMLLYEKKDLHRRDFDKIILPYAPYGSIASFYLWNAAGEKEVLN